MELNSSAHLLYIIDNNNEFKLYNLDKVGNDNCLENILKNEKKDIYNALWADDNPNMICLLEKNKLVFIKDFVEENPIP